jgi:MerR family transcriptional regulator, light-induced transcriptional regulator
LADFATRLKELRKSGGFRQVDLARSLGVAQTTIANYEQHSRFPDEETLGKVATFFGVTLDYLLGRTDSAATPQSASDSTADAAELTTLARSYLKLLLAGKKHEAFDLIMSAVREGATVLTIHREVFTPCLREIGRLWELNEIDIADEHFFSEATETLMGQLYPFLEKTTGRRGVVVAVAVGGELHQIGIRMVSEAFEEAGWECFYLGVNTPTANISRAIVDRGADVLAVSATMPSFVDSVANMISHIRTNETRHGLRPVRIIVGGRAFMDDRDLWRQVKADGFARDPEEAVRLVEALGRSRRAS